MLQLFNKLFLSTDELNNINKEVAQKFTMSEIFIKYNIYDLVILDLMLPNVDGFTILEHIRSIGKCPVLILTAKDSISNKVSFIESYPLIIASILKSVAFVLNQEA